jgi:hypothetical protein
VTTLPQGLFREALLNPHADVPQGLSDSAGQPAGTRFNVYRNNVAVSLTEALHTGFPVLARLLGKQNMDGLAGQFLRAHPPTSPVLMHYGEDLPGFIAALPQLAHLGYLPDMARLELALRRSYHAADAKPIAPEELAKLAPDRFLETRVALAPAVELVRSDWPIFDIWRFNTEVGAPRPAPVAQDVLITRPEFDPAPSPLPAGGAAWIEALQRGETITSALEHAQLLAPDFDMTTPLTQLLAGNALISLTHKD